MLFLHMIQLDDAYWSGRYLDGKAGWDLGAPSPPLRAYIDQWKTKAAAVLIPGCGNAYEVDYMLALGFRDITVIDISAVLVQSLQERWQGLSGIRVIHGDFFEHAGQYDLMLEQTFFCALDPVLRADYVQQAHRLLKHQGTLAGLWFDRNFEGGPPFGGNRADYENLFEPWFHLHTVAPAYNSIAPRAGTELFMIFKKSKETAS
jgi:methyl halide transferase